MNLFGVASGAIDERDRPHVWLMPFDMALSPGYELPDDEDTEHWTRPVDDTYDNWVGV